MGLWLNSWAGDHAGTTVGRQANRALISLTHTDGTFPPGLILKGDLGGVPYYYELYVSCLTPGARDAAAIAVDDVGDYVWSIEVAEVDWGLGKAPWQPGVHLFSVMLLAGGGHQSGTIATVIVDDKVRRIEPKLSHAGHGHGRRPR